MGLLQVPRLDSEPVCCSIQACFVQLQLKRAAHQRQQDAMQAEEVDAYVGQQTRQRQGLHMLQTWFTVKVCM